MDSTYLMSALQALFQPAMGDYSEGNLTVSTVGADPVVIDPLSFAIPVIKGSLMEDATVYVQPNPSSSDGTWQATQAGILVPVQSLQGGMHVNLDEGTELQWSPGIDGLNDPVVGAGGLTGGTLIDQYGSLMQFKNYKDLGKQPDSKAFFAAQVGRFPAAVLSWSSTTPADSSSAYDIGPSATRAGKTTRMFVHQFELYIVTSRMSREDSRRREGDMLRDQLIELIQDRMVWRNLPLCSGPKGLQIIDARLLAVTDSSYIDVIKFGAMFGMRRTEWMAPSPWNTMSMRIDRETSRGPKKTVDDKETVPQTMPWTVSDFRKRMRGEF